MLGGTNSTLMGQLPDHCFRSSSGDIQLRKCLRRVDQEQCFCCLSGESLGEGDCSKLINVSIAGMYNRHTYTYTLYPNKC